MILIGAVAIAFILLTLVILFNGVLFTETVSNSETKDSTTQAEIVEAELEDGLKELIEQELDGTIDLTENENQDLRIATDEYSEEYGDSVSNSRPASVEVVLAEDIDPGDTAAIFQYEYKAAEISVAGTITVEVEVE